MIKKFAYTSLTVVILATFIISPLNSQHASAAELPLYAKTCSNTYLPEWDWPAKVKTPYVTSPTVKNGGNITTFDATNDSYVIIKDASTGDSRNIFHLYRATAGHKLTIDQETISSIVKMTVRVDSGGGIDSDQIISEPTSVQAFKTIWGSTTDNSVVVTEQYTTATPESTPSAPIQYTSTAANCVYAAHNVQYGPTFSAAYSNFSSHVEFTEGGATTSCEALQLGCWVGKIFDGVQDTFKSVGMAIVQGIGAMFVPDSTKIKQSFDDFNTFMQDKLGFLVYPITFLVNVLNAFTSSDSWCSTTSCVKDFGTLFGSDFSVNLAQPGVTMGSIWNWLLLAIRGSTVLALIFAVKQKYKGVVHK